MLDSKNLNLSEEIQEKTGPRFLSCLFRCNSIVAKTMQKIWKLEKKINTGCSWVYFLYWLRTLSLSYKYVLHLFGIQIVQPSDFYEMRWKKKLWISPIWEITNNADTYITNQGKIRLKVLRNLFSIICQNQCTSL